MTKRQIISNLKKSGWNLSERGTATTGLWFPPKPNRFGKHINRGVTLREAASLCLLDSIEDLS
jgi:hypothetical protein